MALPQPVILHEDENSITLGPPSLLPLFCDVNNANTCRPSLKFLSDEEAHRRMMLRSLCQAARDMELIEDCLCRHVFETDDVLIEHVKHALIAAQDLLKVAQILMDEQPREQGREGREWPDN